MNLYSFFCTFKGSFHYLARISATDWLKLTSVVPLFETITFRRWRIHCFLNSIGYRMVCTDKMMSRTKSPIWQNKHKEQDSIPNGPQFLDKEAPWCNSHSDDWLFSPGGFSLTSYLSWSNNSLMACSNSCRSNGLANFRFAPKVRLASKNVRSPLFPPPLMAMIFTSG